MLVRERIEYSRQTLPPLPSHHHNSIHHTIIIIMCARNVILSLTHRQPFHPVRVYVPVPLTSAAVTDARQLEVHDMY